MASLAWEWATKELVALPRRRHFHRRRVRWVIIGGLGVCVCTFLANAFPGTAVALYLFQYLSLGACLILVPTAIVVSGHTFQSERDAGSLGVLVLTDATAGELLHGRLTARYVVTLMAILSLLPLFILLLPLGGLLFRQVVAAGAVLCAAAYLAHALGLWSAACSAGRITLWICLLAMAAVWVAMPLLAQATLGRVMGLEGVADGCSPLVALYRLASPEYLPVALGNAVSSLVAGTVVLLLARRTLDRRLRDGHWVLGPPTTGTRLPTGRPGAEHGSRGVHSSMPLYWREVTIAHHGGHAAWLTVLVGCLPLLLMGPLADVGNGWVIGCVSAGVFQLVLFFFMSMFLTCGAFEAEHRDGVFEILLVADMPLDRMVFEKLLAVARVLWPIPAAALTCLAAGVVGLPSQRTGHGFLLLVDLAFMWLAYGFLGTCLSTQYRRMKAFTICLLVFLIWNAIGRAASLLFIPAISAGGALLLVDCAFHIELILIGTIVAERTLEHQQAEVTA